VGQLHSFSGLSTAEILSAYHNLRAVGRKIDSASFNVGRLVAFVEVSVRRASGLPTAGQDLMISPMFSALHERAAAGSECISTRFVVELDSCFHMSQRSALCLPQDTLHIDISQAMRRSDWICLWPGYPLVMKPRTLPWSWSAWRKVRILLNGSRLIPHKQCCYVVCVDTEVRADPAAKTFFLTRVRDWLLHEASKVGSLNS